MNPRPVRLSLFLFLSLTSLILPLMIQRAHSIGFGTVQRMTNQVGQDTSPSLLQDNAGKVWLTWESLDIPSRNFVIKTMTYTAGVWSTPSVIVSSNANDRHPTMAQMKNGTIFLVWDTNRTGNFEVFYKTFYAGTWSPDHPLTNNTLDDTGPHILAPKDGSLWLVWQRNLAVGTVVDFDVFYKVLRSGVWSNEQDITNNPAPDLLPSVSQIKDGRIWITWARYFSASVSHEIFYKTYDGSTWSSEVQLTSDPRINLSPNIVQDRDGTIWCFWSKELSLPGSQYEDELYYKTSVDNGATWSSDTQLTFDPGTGTPINNDEPSAIQVSSDKRLWLAFSQNPYDLTTDTQDWEIMLMTSDQIFTHDVAVRSAVTGPTPIRTWQNETVASLVANFGDYQESLHVSFILNQTIVLGSVNINLAPGLSAIVGLTWNATKSSVNYGKYLSGVKVDPVPGETLGNIPDNTLSSGCMQVLIPGDIDKNGIVNITDAAILTYAWKSTPGTAKWNPDADINRNGIVDITDAAILSKNWKKSIPAC